MSIYALIKSKMQGRKTLKKGNFAKPKKSRLG